MTLDEAISLARRAHEGVTNQAGRPHIEHPLRVMERLRADPKCYGYRAGDPSWSESTVDESVLIAAVLHDAVEDTVVTAADLLVAGCPVEVVDAVLAVCKRPGESYDDFLRRLSPNLMARRVKLADIDDNADEERLALLPEARAAELRNKCRGARRLLDELLDELLGHANLLKTVAGHPDRHV